MKQAQQGFTLIAILIVIAIIAIIAGFYFSGGEDQKSQFETGQDAVDQARGINQQSGVQARELQEQINLQNDLNTQ